MADEIRDFSPDELKELDELPEMTPEEQSTLRPKRGIGETIVAHGSQGVGAGFMDDVAGGITGLLESTGPGRWLGEKLGGHFRDGDGNLVSGTTGRILEDKDGKVVGGSFTEAGKAGRDEARRTLKETKQDNPKTAVVSEVAGSIASPVSRLAPGAGVTAKLLPKATSGIGRIGARATGAAVDAAAQGTVAGIGYSEGETVGDVAKDALVSGGLSGLIGGAAGGLAGTVREGADSAYIREVVGAGTKPATTTAPAVAARTAATLATDGPAMPSMAGPATIPDPVLPASVAPETPTVFERSPAKTEIGAQAEPDNWHEFLKGRIGPAMAANNNNAAKAIAELSEDWKALQRNRRRAPTMAEPATVLDSSLVDDVLDPETRLRAQNPEAFRRILDPTEANTVPSPSARTVPDIEGARARAAARAPSDVDPMAATTPDMTPPPRIPEAADAAPKSKPKQPEAPTRDQILDAGYRKQAAKDREELTRLIVAEISEGPDGIRPTATANKKLDKADDAIASEVLDGPDKKVVREAYLGKAKPGREKLAKVINDVDSQNEKLYAEFTKAGRQIVDHNAYRSALDKAATAANRAGSPMDTALLDQLISRFDTMVERNKGTPVTLAQLRGWTTEVQGLAASAIGGMNEHTTAALKSRAARLVTEHMYDVMEKAAKGDPALQKAARQIAVNNKRLHGLLTIDEALARRQPKEQVSKTVGQRAAEAATTAALGAGAGALVGDENAGSTALAGGIIGATVGSRGQVAANVGRRLQRGLTKRAIQSADDAARGRVATETAKTAAAINPVNRASVSTLRNLEDQGPEDLSVLTQDELAREIAISSRDPLNGERYRRAIRELQARRQ